MPKHHCNTGKYGSSKAKHTWFISHCDLSGHGVCTFCQMRWDKQ